MNREKLATAALILSVMLIGGICSAQAPTPGQGYVDVTGGKVWYQVVGNGPGTPLLVLHGGPGIPHYYLKPLAGLGQYRPVIFYDQLGCGNSPSPDDTTLWRMDRFVAGVDEVRKALGLDEVDIYGHSWGTMLATQYLLTSPEGVRACVMAGPALSIPRWRKDAAVLLSTLPDSVQQVIRQNEEAGTTDSPEYQAAMMTFYQRYLARKTPWSSDIDSSFAMMNPAMYGYMEGPSEFTITGTIRDYDATSQLHEISVPTLFIIGQYDEVREPTAAYYDSLKPNSELVVVSDAGHLAMQDDSATYVQDIEAFLKQFDDQ